MPKDYKDSPAPRGESRLNHPLLLGIIIGLLLGIVISLAVALWLNRLSNPFVDKGKTVEALPRIAPPQPAPPTDATRAAQEASKARPAEKLAPPKVAEKEKPAEKGAKTAERPRFEFYQILPGEKEAGGKEAGAPPKPAPASPAPAPAVAASGPRPGSSPTSPKPHSGEVYWLQAGAFAEEREADNLKAKIALTGLEALVRPVSVPDRGTLYRVRLGPYQSLDDANRIKATLSQNGVGAAIIRVAEEAKKQ
jgi:cell division protein FtsN